MAPVIPTNAETARITDLGRYYLLYTCPGCGTPGLSEQRLVQVEKPDSLRLERMPGSELNQAMPDNTPTETERDQASRTMGKRIGEGDFSALEGKVVCPRCGKVQPWSGLGKPWYRTILALLTAAFIVAGLIGSRYLAFSRKGSPLLALLPAAVMVLLSAWYVLRRRSRLSSLRRGGGEKPVYCTAAGLWDYADGPYKELVKPYLRRES